eukprot:3963887-Amphidinium_carterae.1
MGSQLRADIALAVKELNRSLQQPDNGDLKNLMQLLRYIKGTIHYKLTLAPKATYNAKNEIQEEHNWDNHICWRTPLRHISRTQSTIALSSAEAELYAMGQVTIKAQHITQEIVEMAIPSMSTHVTMSSNTDSSAGKAVAAE